MATIFGKELSLEGNVPFTSFYKGGNEAMASLAWKAPVHTPRIAWQFYSFDCNYLRQLASGDAAVENHFSSYFGDLLLLKLRARIRSPQLFEDIRRRPCCAFCRLSGKPASSIPSGLAPS